MQPSIREALSGDAQRIAQLCVQLGYTVPLAHVAHFLALPRADRELFVAIVPRVGVVGWIAVTEREALLSSGRADVEGLVVEDEYRSQGVGALLLQAAEEWARRRRCVAVRVRANAARERAREFYLRSGYDLLKTQDVFTKSL